MMKKNLVQFLNTLILVIISAAIPIDAQTDLYKHLSDMEFTKLLVDRATAMRESGPDLPARHLNNMTRILNDARRHADRLTPDGLAFFTVLWSRPDLTLTYDTPSGFFKIHYADTGVDMVDTTDVDENGMSDYVESVADALELVRETNSGAGFLLPPSDGAAGGDGKYDVYLSNAWAGDNVYGYVQGENWIGDHPGSVIEEVDSYTSFVVIRSDYAGFGSTPQARENAMKVTCAHEFFHAVQYGYGTYIRVGNSWVESMTLFMAEGCAAWAEDWVYPGLDDNLQYLPQLFEGHDAALDWNNEVYIQELDGYWYATWLYFRYLTEMTNPDSLDAGLIENLYVRTISVLDNQAIDDELRANYGTSLTGSVEDFYIACVLLSQDSTLAPHTFGRADDYRDYLSGYGFTGLGHESTLAYKGAPQLYDSEEDGNGRLMRLGSDCFRITSDENFTLRMIPKNSADTLSLILLKMNAAVNPDHAVIVQAESADGGWLIDVPDQDAYSHFTALVVNHRMERNLTSDQYQLVLDESESTGTAPAEAMIPQKVALHPAYPNPFNPVTTIRFDLPAAMAVQIDVVDVTGRRAASVFRGRKEAGQHVIALRAGSLASGAYFIRLIADTCVHTQKIMLVR